MASGIMIRQTENAPARRPGGIESVAGIDFETIVRENSAKIFNTAYHMLGNREEAEEAAQEIFLEAYRALPGFRGDAKVSTWLYSITMNVLADCINRKKREAARADGLAVEERERAGGLAAATESAEETFIKSERMETVRRAVLKLPARYRAVFVLNVVEGYSHVEIARILKISPGAARVIRVRAAKMLRRMLSE